MVNLAAAVAPVGEMPVGSMVELPGRGSTYVIDTGTTERDADSPTLVLLHALACTGTLTWYPAIAKLAERRGWWCSTSGGTAEASDPSGSPSRTRRRDDVAALADVLALDRVVPVGYSMGSLVSQLMWKRHRDRVAGLVLCAGAAHSSATRVNGSHSSP
ncbi:alpha/beta fold hydrolase [Rhodococcus hoagii]|nr:alpha/beta fold hydrolase [Prescottella equi]